MDIFNFPNLGEGLTNFKIITWFVKENEKVKIRQTLLSIETEKSIIDIPSPKNGIILKIFKKSGEIIKVGEPLIAFKPLVIEKKNNISNNKHLYTHDILYDKIPSIISKNKINKNKQYNSLSLSLHTFYMKATPFIQRLARKLNVNIHTLVGTGENGIITYHDVIKNYKKTIRNNKLETEYKNHEGFIPICNFKKSMMENMSKSYKEIVPISIFDEIDIEKIYSKKIDITVNLIFAIVYACSKEPSLNSWFNSKYNIIKCFFKEVHLGLAIDSIHGLIVPVIRNAEKYNTETELRNIINNYKKSAHNKTIKLQDLHGATITLSNFGKFSGKFANAVIVPPMVSILAVGRIYKKLVYAKKLIKNHNFLPISLTFDHRIISGGEASRFILEIKNFFKNI